MSKKRIMIVSASHTGHGHQSISDSLVEQLSAYDDVEVQVIDGFSLIGQAGIRASKLYGPLTRNAADLWKLSYNITAKEHGKGVEDIVTALVYDRFMRKLSSFNPDLIVTVHALFNRSLLNILEYHRMNIPFVTLQADIINIHRAWCDPRATLTLCPTPEAYECSRNVYDMPESKLELCGFPTRARFCEAALGEKGREYDGTRPLKCLLMSGGEGSGNLRKYAKQLLDHVDCTMTVICGRNERLRESLEEEFRPVYGERVEVCGFLHNVQDYMLDSDLVIARGSPNTMMEAVVLGVPLMITGALPGQEQDNPALMTTHNLGILCESAESAPALVKALIAKDGKRLKEIRDAQREYRNLDNAKNIAERLYGLAMADDEPKLRKDRFPVTVLVSRYKLKPPHA